MPLFEVAILELPEKRNAEDFGKPERLIMPPFAVIASDAQSAAINAVLEDPDRLSSVDRSRMKVLVRPFV